MAQENTLQLTKHVKHGTCRNPHGTCRNTHGTCGNTHVLYTRVKHSLLASLQKTFVMRHVNVSGIFKSDQESWQIGSSY